MNDITPQSIWEGNARNYFIVTEIKNLNSEIWIFYKSLVNNNEFSCLKESFLDRFRELKNGDPCL